MTLARGIVDVERGMFDFGPDGPRIWRKKMKVIACLKLPFDLY
jgi:hypothetical protein